MLHFQGVPWLPRILQDSPHHKQPTLSTKQWICWSFGWYFKEIDGKVHQGWKTMELWPTQVQSDTHIRKPSITSRGSHRMQAENLSSPDSIQFGKSVEKSRIHQELIKRQPSTSNHYSMELEPGQPVFMKEVYGNVWKTGVIYQTAKEPESYWIKFPDNSILRRTRFMIKPRSQPSYFTLEAEGKEWNSTGIIPPHSPQTFNSMLPALELPALPMDDLVPPALISKATPSVQDNIPVSSTSVSQPSISSSPAVIPSTPRWSTHSNKEIPPVRFTPSKKWAIEYYRSQWKGYFCFA